MFAAENRTKSDTLQSKLQEILHTKTANQTEKIFT
jgi:hypothetical protein